MSFRYKGKEYKSFAQCCRELGLNKTTVYSHLYNNNLTKEEVLDYYLNGGGRKEFVYKNNNYKSFAECCRTFDLCDSTVELYSRKNKISKQEAIDYYIDKKNNKFIYKKNAYNNFKHCCDELGLIYSSVASIANKYNLSPQEAIDYYINNNKKKNGFEYKNKLYNSIKQCCRELGINYSSIISIKVKHNLSYQDAIEYYLNNNCKRSTFEYKGVNYDSFIECCDSNNISYGKVNYYAKKNNVTKQEAIDYLLNNNLLANNNKKRKISKNKVFVFHGNEYESFKACCESFGLNSNNVHSIERTHNITKQEAIEYYINGGGLKSFRYNGENYKSVAECCKVYDIKIYLIEKYSKSHGVSKQDALKHYLSKPSTEVIYNGIRYSSLKICCNELGYKYETIRKYMKKYNMTIEEAINHYMERKFVYDNKIYNSFAECCRVLGLSENAVDEYARRNKISKQEAIDCYITNQVNNHDFVYNDVKYKSFVDCCKELNLNYNTVNSYILRYNISKQEAIDYYIRKRTNKS